MNIKDLLNIYILEYKYVKNKSKYYKGFIVITKSNV